MTYCQRMRALSWLGACLVVPLAGVAAEPQPIASQASKLPDEATLDEAPADAWPLFRGCLAGTGRSATTLAMPLRERWHRAFEKTAFEAGAVIADGTIYIGDLDGTFHALALETGTTQWTFRTESGFSSSAAIAIDPAHPLVVVGDSEGTVRAFERGTGAVRWEYETNGEISGGPTIIEAEKDGPEPAAARVLVGSQDASLSCLALADGTLLWKHVISDQIRCAPTVANGKVFLAGCDGLLHVIDARTGKSKADVRIDGPTGTTPAAADARVYFGSEGGVFWAIDFDTAAVAWKVAPAANPQAYRSSAAIADGLTIVGSRGKAIEALQLADGVRKWRVPMRGRVDGSPVVVRVAHAGDTAATHVAAIGPHSLIAIVGDSAGRIVAVHTADGTLAWDFDAGGGFTGSPAVAAGHLVMASDDGTLWCFGATK